MEYKTIFNGEIKIIKSKIFEDDRGYFSEIYNRKNFNKIGISDNFVQDNISYSLNKGTVRGLHFQKPPFGQSKLIMVTKGCILDVVVDLRKNSSSYGKYETIKISHDSFDSIYIPEYFAHGFCTLANDTEVKYKVSNYYSKTHEQTILWNDDFLSIPWNINKNKVTVSEKDKNGILFENFISPY